MLPGKPNKERTCWIPNRFWMANALTGAPGDERFRQPDQEHLLSPSPTSTHARLPGLGPISLFRRWRHVALLLAAMTLGFAAALPVVSLVRTTPGAVSRLTPDHPLGATGLDWGKPAHEARSTDRIALDRVSLMLLTTALGTLVVAGLTALMTGLALGRERRADFQVARAVGASGRRIARDVLLEAGVVTAVGLSIGGAVGSWLAGRALATWPGAVTPGSFALTVPVAAMIAGVVAFALLTPALRVGSTPLTRPSTPGRPLVLSAIQSGIALVVLTAAALLLRHAGSEEGRHPGPLTERGQRYEIISAEPSLDLRAAGLRGLLETVARSWPFASLTSPGALQGLGTVSAATTECGVCPLGELPPAPRRLHFVDATHHLVSADSFAAMGVHLRAGRGITDEDTWDTAERVAVVNHTLAVRHFENGDAIGRRIRLGTDPRHWHRVVGIVDDPPSALGGTLQPEFTVYASILQHPTASADLLVRREEDGGDGIANLTETGARAGVTVIPRGSERAVAGENAAQLRWFGRWFLVEGVALLVLATGGAFVAMLLWVRGLWPELAVRRAVGATRARVLAWVLVRAAGAGLSGAALGLWFGPSLWLGLGDLIGGLPGWDGALAVRLTALLIGVSLAGAALPAWRAAREAPARILDT